MTTTVTIKFAGHEMEVTGYYQPEEDPVYYYSDGSGYPGCGAEFEASEVIYKGVDILDLMVETGTIERIEELAIEALTVKSWHDE